MLSLQINRNSASAIPAAIIGERSANSQIESQFLMKSRYFVDLILGGRSLAFYLGSSRARRSMERRWPYRWSGQNSPRWVSAIAGFQSAHRLHPSNKSATSGPPFCFHRQVSVFLPRAELQSGDDRLLLSVKCDTMAAFDFIVPTIPL
jgi:hypothetical protein